MGTKVAELRSSWWQVVDAVDEWAHRHGLMKSNGEVWGAWRFTPFRLLCNYRDRALCGKQDDDYTSGDFDHLVERAEPCDVGVTSPHGFASNAVCFNFMDGTVSQNLGNTGNITWTWNMPTKGSNE
jgi:hypothetical protein